MVVFNMTFFALIVLGLATWRISALLSREAGPFRIFEKIRILSGIKHDGDGSVFYIPPRFFAELLSCVWCVSIWVGTAWYLFWLLTPTFCVAIAIPFALSAVAILLDKLA
jgi:hypothetical protein